MAVRTLKIVFGGMGAADKPLRQVHSYPAVGGKQRRVYLVIRIYVSSFHFG